MENTDIKIPWDGWEYVEKIGRGQFGSVYKISCTRYGITEYAAMKVISIPGDPQMIENDYSYGYDKASVAAKYKSYLDDVIKEFQLMMRIKGSPNVVRCDDISVDPHDDGIGWDVFIRMEYLTPVLRVLPDISNEDSIIKLGIDICGALDVCEKANIIHRDIKPSNILISEIGDFKLGDFGVSRTLESENTYGTKGIGTYDYMAPEIYNGGKYGKVADIYSLGMVMYWLLNNRTFPFLIRGKAPTAQEITVARQKRFDGERLPRPSMGSDALVSVVLRACDFNPDDRYHNAQEMLNDLVNIKYGKTTEAVVLPNQHETVENAVVKEQQVSQPDANNTWNDTSATVGKSYYAEGETDQINDSETVGKEYNKSGNKGKAKTVSKIDNDIKSQSSNSEIKKDKKETKPKNVVFSLFSLIFAFILPLVGFVMCLIGKKRSRKKGKKGTLVYTLGIVIASAVFVFHCFCVCFFLSGYLVRVKDINGSVNGDVYTSRVGKVSYTLDDDEYFYGMTNLQDSYNSYDGNKRLSDLNGDWVLGSVVSSAFTQNETEMSIFYYYDINAITLSEDEFLKRAYKSEISIALAGPDDLQSKIPKSYKVGDKTYPGMRFLFVDNHAQCFVVVKIFNIQKNGIVTCVQIRAFEDEDIEEIIDNLSFN